MNAAWVLVVLAVAFVYGLGMFYLGVKAAMNDYEARLARARSVRFHQEAQ